MARRYDVDMIEDFLDHLQLRIRLAYHRQIPDSNAICGELEEAIIEYGNTYRAELLPRTKVDLTNVAFDDRVRILERVTEMNRQKYEKWLAAFGQVKELLYAALECARYDWRDRSVPTRVVRPADLLGGAGLRI